MTTAKKFFHLSLTRSNGVAVGSVAARIGAIMAPFLIDLEDFVFWLPNITFGVLSKSHKLLP